MSEDDADVCVHCLHPAGCEHVDAEYSPASLGPPYPVNCNCSEHPDPYDPSAP